jgi:hypothetical protein
LESNLTCPTRLWILNESEDDEMFVCGAETGEVKEIEVVEEPPVKRARRIPPWRAEQYEASDDEPESAGGSTSGYGTDS